MRWSKYQNKIFYAVRDTDDNIVIDAVAGSGKSTTLFKITSILKDKNVLFFAFNTHIEQYASKKIGKRDNVKVQTTHSYGLSCLKKSPKFAHAQMNTSKVWDCMVKNCKEGSIYGKLFATLNTLRSFGCLRTDPQGIKDYVNSNPELVLQLSGKEFVLKHLDTVSRLLCILDNTIMEYDFNDMLRFPIIYRLMGYGYLPEVLLVDECQDLSEYQFKYVEHFLENDVRTIVVGDEFQAIYSFRGACGNALSTIESMSQATRLPLSISYRCKSNLIKYLKRIYKMSEHAPPNIEHAEEGGDVYEVLGTPSDPYALSVLLEENVTMIISPKNKHIISIWYDLLTIHKTPSSLKGSNICSLLTRLFKALKSDVPFKNIVPHLIRIASDSNSLEEQADMAETGLRFLQTRTFRSYDDVLAEIKQLERDNTSKIHLHTVHSSKGLEADSIFLVNDFFDSSQLMNMKYVAYTRAKSVIYEVVKYEPNRF